MQMLAVGILLVTICSGSGVTVPSGLDQFWTDDYKIFKQVLGKTSDKEIYGQSVPESLPISFTTAPKIAEASENKEYLLKQLAKYEDTFDPYDFGDKFNFAKQLKPEKPKLNFISVSDFKPISESSDPDAYTYLKHLEEAERAKSYVKSLTALKPYFAEPDPEETEAYKSIQEIIDAHEANKSKNDEDDGNSKYLTYREKPKPQAKKKPFRPHNEGNKNRCAGGRCRNRSSHSFRSRPRPYYTIKHIKY